MIDKARLLCSDLFHGIQITRDIEGSESFNDNSPPQDRHVNANNSEKPGRRLTDRQYGHLFDARSSVSCILSSLRRRSAVSTLWMILPHSLQMMSAKSPRSNGSRSPQHSGSPKSEWGRMYSGGFTYSRFAPIE